MITCTSGKNLNKDKKIDGKPVQTISSILKKFIK